MIIINFANVLVCVEHVMLLKCAMPISSSLVVSQSKKKTRVNVVVMSSLGRPNGWDLRGQSLILLNCPRKHFFPEMSRIRWRCVSLIYGSLGEKFNKINFLFQFGLKLEPYKGFLDQKDIPDTKKCPRYNLKQSCRYVKLLSNTHFSNEQTTTNETELTVKKNVV